MHIQYVFIDICASILKQTKKRRISLGTMPYILFLKN